MNILRKRQVASSPDRNLPWLAIEDVAEVDVLSEHPDWPIEGALLLDDPRGWHAAEAGQQRVRIRFDTPQALHHIQLIFDEAACERVQEFALRWSADRGHTFRELLRQQFAFSPDGATREVEDYAVRLSDVTELELQLTPDISNTPVIATLTSWRLA